MSIVDTASAGIPYRLLHSPAEVEILLGVSRATLYRLLKARRLDAVKIGSSTRVTRASIERFLGELSSVGAR